jgi:cyclic beta-1,2-glucan synthetase
MHVTTEIDPVSGALFARNAYNTEFTGRVGFFHVDAQNRTVTADRTEFVGRNRTLASPAAMGRARLSGKIGAALDPCAALQVPLELQPGEERQVVFMLGVGGRRNADATDRRRWPPSTRYVCTGITPWPRCRSKRPIRRSTSSPMAG